MTGTLAEHPMTHGDPPPIAHSRRRLSQMTEAFNVYRTSTLLDVLDRPRTFAFVDGVVVESAARVVSADPGGLVLAIDRGQLAALETTRTLLVESPLHGTTFRAEVEVVDHRRGLVSIRDLTAFHAYHERRGHGRTVPGTAMLARVCGLGREARGRVVDLSPRALAADFDRDGFHRVARAPLVRVDVWGEHDTPSLLEDFEATAHIRRTEEHSDHGKAACRVVLELDAYPALERALRRYVAGRQREILTRLGLAGSDADPAA